MHFQMDDSQKQAEALQVCLDCQVQWPYQNSLAGKDKSLSESPLRGAEFILARDLCQVKQSLAGSRREGPFIWGIT